MSDRTSHHQLGGSVVWASQASALSIQEEEAPADVDEPPDNQRPKHLNTSMCWSAVSSTPTTPESPAFFHKETIRRQSVQKGCSLLTIALKDDEDQDIEEDDHRDRSSYGLECQRSMSMSSAADLTSDTGLTSPSRANTPSPPPPDMVHLMPSARRTSIAMSDLNRKKRITFACPTPTKPKTGGISFACATPPKPKPRGISFACGTTGDKPKPKTLTFDCPTPKRPTVSTEEPAPRTRSIKFACGGEKLAASPRKRCMSPPPAPHVSASVKAAAGFPPVFASAEPESASTIHAPSPIRSPVMSPPNAITPSVRPLPKIPRKFKIDETAIKNKKKPTYFNAFVPEASADQWFSEQESPIGRKITINDTLCKENALRRLAQEVEEEEGAEEDMEEVSGLQSGSEHEDEEEEDDDDMVEDDEDVTAHFDEEMAESDDDYSVDSDGYRTDEETGFAESDDEDDDLHLWVLTNGTPVSSPIDVSRKIAVKPFSNSSSYNSRQAHKKLRCLSIRPGTPELPDSTDFVCGTFDEDRPMESAYLSCIEQRRLQKLRPIPQDIDPSFPASDPEDETVDMLEAIISSVSDCHPTKEELDTRRRSIVGSPAPRYHSPPPKGRASRRQKSPMLRARSPAPSIRQRISPLVSPAANVAREPPARYLVPTKSLPRPAAMVASKFRKGRTTGRDQHLRGAIDIMKGLEYKRLKRKDKLYKEYCNRARKGQMDACKVAKGEGAEKMKVVGLLHSGKNIAQVKAELQKPAVEGAANGYMMSV